MMSKQLPMGRVKRPMIQSWGRSSAVLLLLLFLTTTYIQPMEEQSYSDDESYFDCESGFEDFEDDEEKQHDDYKYVPPMSDDEKKSYICEGRTWQEMMEAFQDAPDDAKLIVDHLQNPGEIDLAWRSAIFVGKPGTGKTTVALAIPHLVHWYFDFIESTKILGEYRNQAKNKLEMHFERAVSGKRKTIIIIDEINRLLENFDSKNHDTDSISSALWMFLDRQKYNKNFFFIGTMNRDNKIPDPLKHRIGGTRVEFPPLKEHLKLKIFKNKMESTNKLLHKECNDIFLECCIQELGKETTPRDYENVRFKVARLIYLENKKHKSDSAKYIMPSHLIKAVQYVRESYDKMEYGSLQLTEEEWREFHAVQNKIIDIKLQCAQKIQGSLSLSLFGPSGTISRAPGIDLDEAIEILNKELSEDQKRLYRRVMQRDELIERNSIDTYKQKMREKTQSTINKYQEIKKKYEIENEKIKTGDVLDAGITTDRSPQTLRHSKKK